MMDAAAQRELMVREQLARRGIRDEAVLRAMREVPREAFLRGRAKRFAYEDTSLPIEEAQTISQPYIVALMAEALELGPASRVLEVGTGSGYHAAVLSRIAAAVYSVERHEPLVRAAAVRFAGLGYTNIHLRHGDGTLGWPEQAPFDAIIVTAGAPAVPRPLRAQLTLDGRLVLPVGGQRHQQELVRVRRTGPDSYVSAALGPVRFVPLIGEAGWAAGGEGRGGPRLW